MRPSKHREDERLPASMTVDREESEVGDRHRTASVQHDPPDELQANLWKPGRLDLHVTLSYCRAQRREIGAEDDAEAAVAADGGGGGVPEKPDRSDSAARAHSAAQDFKKL